jgi:hypothetical protein
VTSVLRSVWQRLVQLDSGLLSSRASPGIHVEGAFLSVKVGLDENREAKVATDAIIGALAALTDPRTGKPVFARVARRSDAASWTAAWPYPGDIVAQAALGYTLAAAPSARDAFSETPVYGQTGYSAHQMAMQGVLIAAGRGVVAGQEKDITHLMQLALMAAEWLNISPPIEQSLNGQD